MKIERVKWRQKPIRTATTDELMPFVKRELKRNKKFYDKLADM